MANLQNTTVTGTLSASSDITTAGDLYVNGSQITINSGSESFLIEIGLVGDNPEINLSGSFNINTILSNKSIQAPSFSGNINGTTANITRITGSISGSAAQFATITGSQISGSNITGSFSGSYLGNISGTLAQFTNISASSFNISDSSVIDVSSSAAALRITQRGTGEAIRVEDETNPDSTPFVVNLSGNVGIGTSANTSYALDIVSQGAGAVSALRAKATGITSTGKITEFVNGNDITVFSINGNGNTFVSGNLGVGLDNPTNKLQVRVSPSSDFQFSGSTTSGYSTKFSLDDTGVKIYNNSSLRDIQIGTNNTTALTISGSQKIGIGTTSPQKKLHINDSGLLIDGQTIVDSAPYTPRLMVDSGASFGHVLAHFKNDQRTVFNISGSNVSVTTGSVGTPGISFVEDSDTGIYSPAPGQFSFVSNGNETAKITGSHLYIPSDNHIMLDRSGSNPGGFSNAIIFTSGTSGNLEGICYSDVSAMNYTSYATQLLVFSIQDIFTSNNRPALSQYDKGPVYNIGIGCTYQLSHHVFISGTSIALSGAVEVMTGNDLQITDGNLVLGASGKGISFANTTPDGTSPDSELLDDYEEGTWTPAFSGSTTAGSFTYTDTAGSYTKIGNVVYITCFLRVTATTTALTGTVNITGLPFTVHSTGVGRTCYGTVGHYSGMSTNINVMAWHTVPNSTRLNLFINTTESTSLNTLLAGTDLSTTPLIRLSGFYYVN